MSDDFSRMAVLKLIPPRRKRDYLHLARISFCLLLLGVVLDEFSTWLVIESGIGYETKPFVVSLMQKGLWLPYDFAIIVLSMIIVNYCYQRWRRWEPLVFPALYGTLRFLAACHNFLFFL